MPISFDELRKPDCRPFKIGLALSAQVVDDRMSPCREIREAQDGDGNEHHHEEEEHEAGEKGGEDWRAAHKEQFTLRIPFREGARYHFLNLYTVWALEYPAPPFEDDFFVLFKIFVYKIEISYQVPCECIKVA